MAISEETKRVVKQQRDALQSRINTNLKDIADLQAQIATRKSANVALKAEYDALKKDIPEPTPPTPVVG